MWWTVWGIHSASKGCGGQCGGYIVLARGVAGQCGGYIVLARGVVDSVGDT